eukprot:Gregarina_sp_Poly_1__1259@NODE_1305_length_4428_cov_899_751204_g874_i1_p3_GENE_NODE_1305_length_4428_cov_899_751204_g874_i1NODE_1305_length_4428_cov_899_751204_g874_i1_p3_ORF_typecomplete_len207_score30_80Acetyltransf_1/PF00583_25/4_4e14Acetyltransf_10/PF13673_7/1_3e13Acetyltransf_7/PF13508_7/1_4e08FR47/PF08445_10/4_1e05Acetyltransf_4/PF13420_7/4_7e05GNAT_acetyltran/PF12746_7/0_018Acetyltransf_9/PF13527_7/0_027Acetyltransf_CG/PF14542_6/0_29_NODE_1305_length_4428_cov_899_751204_g874_i110531673
MDIPEFRVHKFRNLQTSREFFHNSVWIYNHERNVVSSGPLVSSMVDFTRFNMKDIYEQDEWENPNGVVGWSDEQKTLELTESQHRYIFVTSSLSQVRPFLKLAECSDGEISDMQYLIGFIVWFQDGRTGFIMELGVDKLFHKKGFGKLLMTEFETEAKARNMKYTQLNVQKSNVRAFNFYRKLNYEIGETGPNYWMLRRRLATKKK